MNKSKIIKIAPITNYCLLITNVALVLVFVAMLFLPIFTQAQLLDDSRCTQVGGTCKTNTGPASCSGSFRTGLCAGNANRQCCVPGNTKTDTIKGDASKTDTLRTGGNVSIKIPNPLGVNTFADLIARINNWLVWIGGPILTLFIFIGAFQLMTAGGNPEQITKGRHTITYAVIGYALLLISTGITTIIRDVLGG